MVTDRIESELLRGLSLIQGDLLEGHLDVNSIVDLLEIRRQVFTSSLPVWQKLENYIPTGTGQNLGQQMKNGDNNPDFLGCEGIFFSSSRAGEMLSWCGLAKPEYGLEQALWVRFDLTGDGLLVIRPGIDLASVIKFYYDSPDHVLWELDNAMEKALCVITNPADECQFRDIKAAFSQQSCFLAIWR